MSIKKLTVLKFIAMVVAPFLFEFVLLDLEYSGGIRPDQNALLHLLFYSLMAVSLYKFFHRCKKCGRWHAVKEISREEINRMEHPTSGRAKRKKFQVRFAVIKKCKFCGDEKLYEVVKEIVEKQ